MLLRVAIQSSIGVWPCLHVRLCIAQAWPAMNARCMLQMSSQSSTAMTHKSGADCAQEKFIASVIGRVSRTGSKLASLPAQQIHKVSCKYDHFIQKASSRETVMYVAATATRAADIAILNIANLKACNGSSLTTCCNSVGCDSAGAR